MKMTAVEWLEIKIREQGKSHFFSLRELFQQAKELDKQQKMDAWNDGNCNTDLKGNPSANYAISAEHYYNQKYGGNNDQQ